MIDVYKGKHGTGFICSFDCDVITIKDENGGSIVISAEDMFDMIGCLLPKIAEKMNNCKLDSDGYRYTIFGNTNTKEENVDVTTITRVRFHDPTTEKSLDSSVQNPKVKPIKSKFRKIRCQLARKVRKI